MSDNFLPISDEVSRYHFPEIVNLYQKILGTPRFNHGYEIDRHSSTLWYCWWEFNDYQFTICFNESVGYSYFWYVTKSDYKTLNLSDILNDLPMSIQNKILFNMPLFY